MAPGSANLALIEGTRPVIEAIRAGRRQVRVVYLPEGDGSAAQRELETLLAARAIERRDAKRGEGVHGLADPFPEEDFEALLSGASPRFLVALDRVTDVGNLGSIARSAEGAGAHGLILEYRHAPPIAPGALRASAGALEHLRVGRTPNLAKAIELARGEGMAVLVADAKGVPLEEIPASIVAGDLVWVFGSEDLGARPAVRKGATAIVGISLSGKLGSLGVSAAAAHLLFRTAEVRRSAAGANIAGRAKTS